MHSAAGAQRGLVTSVPAHSAFRAVRHAYSGFYGDRYAPGPRHGGPSLLLRPICSVHPSARSESEHENQQPGRFQRRLARRCAAAPRLAEAAVPRQCGSGRRGRFRRQRRRPGHAGSAGGHADQRVPAQRHGYAQPARSVELGAAACPVRDQIHGQQRSRGLRGLAHRATLRGTWLHHADRPAHLQPLAGPRLRPPGERPLGHRPIGPGPADLLLPLLRADAARRRDRRPGRPRHLSARQRLHHGLLGTGQGRDRAGADRAAGIRPGPWPDGHRRLRAGQDFRSGRRGLHGYAAALAHPAWQGIFEPVPLLDARNAGVLGVVCAWTGLPDNEVINQYNPFITPYPAASGLPAPGDPAAPRYGSATRPAPSCPGSPPAARRARRSCSPRTSPRARRPRRSGAR